MLGQVLQDDRVELADRRRGYLAARAGRGLR
jgi:hypothetical protein